MLVIRQTRREWGIAECSKEVRAPLRKELEEKIGVGEEFGSDVAAKVREGSTYQQWRR